MTISSARDRSVKAGASAALGLLLVGVVTTPAYADSTRSMEWHLDAMHAEEMWKTSTGKGVVVAVIDSGVDASNPDLQGQVLSGKDLSPDSPGDERTDYETHGTGMAGLIAGTGNWGGGRGALGLAPGAKVLPVRMPNDAGRVNGATGDAHFNRDLPIAIRFAVDHGAKVINISLASEVGSHQVTDAVKYALDRGALIFAAVGNDGDGANQLMYPAATPGVVGVGALDKDLQKTDESQYGSQVDLSAPGEEMVHACGAKTGLCKSHGTSDATAIASASAALIWSEHPDWTNNQVLRVMLNTAGAPTDGSKRNDYVGYGAVRPRIALKTPGDPGPADVYPLPDLAAADRSPSPSARPSRANGGSVNDGRSGVASPVSDDTGSRAGLWTGLGSGAAVLVGALVAVLAVRSRRRKYAAATPSSYPHPQPHNPYLPYGPPPAPDRSRGQGPTA